MRGGMRGGRWVLRVLRHKFESRSDDLGHAEGFGIRLNRNLWMREVEQDNKDLVHISFCL